MRRIVLERLLGELGRAVRVDELHHATEGRTLVIYQQRWTVHQAVGGVHAGHALHQRVLEPRGEDTLLFLVETRALVVVAVVFIAVLLVAVLALLGRARHLAALDADQLSSAVRGQVVHHKVVEAGVQEEHLGLALLEGLVVGRGLRELAVGHTQEVDVLLVLGHALHVGVQRGELTVRLGGRLAAQQTCDVLLPLGIGADALLEEVAKLVEEVLAVALLVAARLIGQELEHTPGEQRVEPRDQRTVLQHLATEVERHVLAVHHALHEAQPVRQQARTLGLNEHAAAVQRNARLLATHTVLLGVLLWHVEHALHGERHVRLEHEVVERLVVGVRDELIELLVLFLAHLLGGQRPQRLHRVDRLAVQPDVKVDKVRELVHHLLNGVSLRELESVLAQVDHNPCAASHTIHLRDLVATGAVRHPSVATALRITARTRVHLHLVAHHECRVETDTELPDHLCTRLALALHLLQKLTGARVRDHTQVVLQLLFGHTHTGVGDLQDTTLLVGRDLHLQRSITCRHGHFLIGVCQLVTQLLQCIRCVRNQLTNKDLSFRVERTSNNIQELASFCFEFVGFTLVRRRCRRRKLTRL
mmetsp:Transcript_42069/g.106161  ORF Transcript_42069/g.106161 Transcript_42069/m.106161 type:complete len:589 (-) Transcript_42069:265-2031(-)